MAQGGERRMLFDIRGRRKNVIRVVYAILALLMGASLFFVVGPFNVANLIGSSETVDAGKLAQERVERLEVKLRQEPKSETLLASLTRAHLSAANAFSEKDPATGATVLLPEGHNELEAASQTWDRYLEVAEPANPQIALLMARGYFGLAETSAELNESQRYVKLAAEAQKVAAEGQPTVNTLTSLAIYEYYAGDFGAGDAAAREAEATAPKPQRKEIKKQMAEFRKRGKEFQSQKKEFAKSEGERSEEAIQNPFGELGGSELGQ
jgi:hypothetical protein